MLIVCLYLLLISSHDTWMNLPLPEFRSNGEDDNRNADYIRLLRWIFMNYFTDILYLIQFVTLRIMFAAINFI